ncbi:hypothetical protein FQN49_008041, partial [Arthroderma sp. PD_2]
GRKNYYATPPGFKSHRKEVTERSSSVCKRRSLSPSLPPEPQIRHRQQRRHICYQSDTLTVVQEPLGSAEECERAPYLSWEDRMNFDALWAKQKQTAIASEGILIHSDLDTGEMDAIYSFLADGPKPESDILPQDLIIQCLQKPHVTKDGIASLVERLKYLGNVYKVLSRYTPDLDTFFLGCRSGKITPDIKRDTHMALICQFLTEQPDVWAPVLDKNHQSHLVTLLQEADEVQLKALVKDITQAGVLRHRSSRELKAFLTDAMSGKLPTSPLALRAYPAQFDGEILRYDLPSALSHLRARELGYPLYRARSSINRTLAKSANEKWKHHKSWHNASHDVVSLDWSPDGTRFAAGSATYFHPQTMTYNKRNNLIIGDLSTNSAKELPDHRVPRALLDTNMSNTENTISDPYLYTTISAVAWSNDGNRMYSASYDNTVKIWDTTSHYDTGCIVTLRHTGKVHVMALSKLDNSLLATGSDSDSTFQLWKVEQDYGLAFSTPLELTLRHNKTIVPASIAWGSTSQTKNLLSGGLGLYDTDKQGDPPAGGNLALWQVEEAGVSQLNVSPNSQNVFDIAWHPVLPHFAAGIAARGRSRGLGSDIRSMVMIYDPLRSKRDIVSYDCPGLDINYVTFCPFNENYVTASCTDGTTFVWDFRNPDEILHRMQHGKPIRTLDAQLTRDQADIGVRLALWGDEQTRFYTGSSDGYVKSWNIMAATEDVFTEDVANFGHEITSGALSPDKTSLMIGDTSGVHILSTSNPPTDDKGMSFQRADEQETEEAESGIQAANQLIESGQVVRHAKFGPGKGPRYRGPYAAWARPPDTPVEEVSSTPLALQVQTKQLYGPPVKKRPGLDHEAREQVKYQIRLATIRNKRTFSSTPLPSSRNNSRIAEGNAI